MSRDLNKVMIIGRLGRNPEMRYISSGHPITKFSVATTRSWMTQEGERRTETEWFNVVTWDRLAEICNQYLEKGVRVYVEGRLQTRKWEGADGTPHSITEIIADEMLILSPRQESNQNENDITEEFDLKETSFEDEDLDEFPF